VPIGMIISLEFKLQLVSGKNANLRLNSKLPAFDLHVCQSERL
jgi:hypothetical protein